MKKVLALTLILTLAAVSTSYAIVNQLEQSEEQMLNGLENQFAEGEDTASFSQLDREAELNDIPSGRFRS